LNNGLPLPLLPDPGDTTMIPDPGNPTVDPVEGPGIPEEPVLPPDISVPPGTGELEPSVVFGYNYYNFLNTGVKNFEQFLSFEMMPKDYVSAVNDCSYGLSIADYEAVTGNVCPPASCADWVVVPEYRDPDTGQTMIVDCSLDEAPKGWVPAGDIITLDPEPILDDCTETNTCPPLQTPGLDDPETDVRSLNASAYTDQDIAASFDNPAANRLPILFGEEIAYTPDEQNIAKFGEEDLTITFTRPDLAEPSTALACYFRIDQISEPLTVQQKDSLLTQMANGQSLNTSDLDSDGLVDTLVTSSNQDTCSFTFPKDLQLVQNYKFEIILIDFRSTTDAEAYIAVPSYSFLIGAQALVQVNATVIN
jgi:hypothetical protein